MTYRDRHLLAKASTIHYTLWYEVFDLIDKADTDEAKVKLKQIGMHLYHKDEYEHGML